MKVVIGDVCGRYGGSIEVRPMASDPGIELVVKQDDQVIELLMTRVEALCVGRGLLNAADEIGGGE